MHRQNQNRRAEEIEKKYRRKDDRRRKKMKVSGAGVKQLQRLIRKKGKV